MGKSTISMAIFNSYVSLPEGNHPRMAQNFPILICHVPKIHIFLFGGDWNHGFFDFPYIGNNDPNWRTHILSDGLKPPTSFCLVSIAINGIVLTVICCMVWIVIYLLIYWLLNGKKFLLFSFSQFSGGKKRDVRVSKLCQGTAQRYCCEWSFTVKHYPGELLTSDIPSGTMYGIFILTFYLTFFLADTMTFYLTFYLAFYLAYILTYFLAYLLTFFRPFYLGYLRRFFVVEVRQGTLWSEAQGAVAEMTSKLLFVKWLALAVGAEEAAGQLT